MPDLRRWRLAGLALAAWLPLAAGCSLFDANDARGVQFQWDQVVVATKGTPGGKGLAAVMIEEAAVVFRHVSATAERLNDLEWMQTNVRNVRHAIDPAKERHGPGLGFGLLKAARGTVARIWLAVAEHDAPEEFKAQATPLAAAANNVVTWSSRILLLCESVLATDKVDRAATWVERMEEAAEHLLEGQDLDGDGDINWEKGEGGLSQAREHFERIGYLIR